MMMMISGKWCVCVRKRFLFMFFFCCLASILYSFFFLVKKWRQILSLICSIWIHSSIHVTSIIIAIFQAENIYCCARMGIIHKSFGYQLFLNDFFSIHVWYKLCVYALLSVSLSMCVCINVCVIVFFFFSIYFFPYFVFSLSRSRWFTDWHNNKKGELRIENVLIVIWRREKVLSIDRSADGSGKCRLANQMAKTKWFSNKMIIIFRCV